MQATTEKLSPTKMVPSSRCLSAMSTELRPRLQGRSALRARRRNQRSSALLAETSPQRVQRLAVRARNAGVASSAGWRSAASVPTAIAVAITVMRPTMVAATLMTTEKSVKNTHLSFLFQERLTRPLRPTNGSHHNFSKHSHSLGQCKEVPRRSFSALTSLQNKSCRRCLACKIHLRDNLRTGRDFKTAFCFKLVTRWFQINLLLVAT